MLSHSLAHLSATFLESRRSLTDTKTTSQSLDVRFESRPNHGVLTTFKPLFKTRQPDFSFELNCLFCGLGSCGVLDCSYPALQEESLGVRRI